MSLSSFSPEARAEVARLFYQGLVVMTCGDILIEQFL